MKCLNRLSAYYKISYILIYVESLCQLADSTHFPSPNFGWHCSSSFSEMGKVRQSKRGFV